MRKGSAILVLILLLLIISGILTLALKSANLSKAHTYQTGEYLDNNLLLENSIELTMLAIIKYQRNFENKCLKEIIFKKNDKKIKVNILKYYFYKNKKDILYCNLNNSVETIETEKSNGTVWFELFLTDEKNTTRIYKNVIQKI